MTTLTKEELVEWFKDIRYFYEKKDFKSAATQCRNLSKVLNQ